MEIVPITRQEISKEISSIDFIAVQCDDIHANAKLIFLREKLINEFSKEDAVCILFNILEAKECVNRAPLEFCNMLEFYYINKEDFLNRSKDPY